MSDLTLCIILFVILLIAGAAARVDQMRRILGPSRFKLDQPAWPLIAAVMASIGAFILVPNIYAAYKMTQARNSNATMPATAPPSQEAVHFSQAEEAVVSAVAALAAATALIVTHLLIRPQGLRDLGILPSPPGTSSETSSNLNPIPRRTIFRGIWTGLVGIAIAMPLVIFTGIATEWVLQYFQLQHPEAHDLLLTYGGTRDIPLRVIIVVEAVILAPLCEEILFRAHVQTLLLRFLTRLFGGQRKNKIGFEVILPTAGGRPENYIYTPPEPIIDPAIDSLSSTGQTRSSAGSIFIRWIPIVLTSVLFALLHPWWSTPQIFVLAICLGYAYERTGNLWTSITMHASFNGLMVLFYVLNLPGVS